MKKTSHQDGFAIVPRSIIEIGSVVGPLAFYVLVILIDHANEDGECWPSRELIAKRTGMSLKSVGNQLSKLKEHGFIEIKNRTGGPNPRSNVYVLLEPCKSKGHEVPVCDPKGHEVPAKQVRGAHLKGHEVPTNKNHRIRTKNEEVLDVSIPEILDTELFRDAWSEWIGHKRDIKDELTPRAAKMALKKLAGWGPARAITAIEHSISNVYKGIYEPSSNGKKPNEPEPEIEYRNAK